MKIALVASIGGHLTELDFLQNLYEGHDVFLITNALGRKSRYRQYELPVPPFTPWRVFYCCWKTLHVLWREKPDCLLSTGAEIAIPAVIVARIMGKKTVFLETVSRFERPTLTGRICYWLCHVFLVQHPQMLKRYGRKARYEGSVI